MDRGAWRATVHGGHKESDTTQQLNNNSYVVVSPDYSNLHFPYHRCCGAPLHMLIYYLYISLVRCPLRF